MGTFMMAGRDCHHLNPLVDRNHYVGRSGLVCLPGECSADSTPCQVPLAHQQTKIPAGFKQIFKNNFQWTGNARKRHLKTFSIKCLLQYIQHCLKNGCYWDLARSSGLGKDVGQKQLQTELVVSSWHSLNVIPRNLDFILRLAFPKMCPRILMCGFHF